MIRTSGKSVIEAQKALKKKLKIDDDIDLTTFDSIFELENGQDKTKKEKAKKVLAQQTKIQVIFNMAYSTIKSSSSNPNESNISLTLFKYISILIETGTKIGSKEAIEEIINKTAEEVYSKDNEALKKVKKNSSAIATKAEEASTLAEENIEAIDLNVESGPAAIIAANKIMTVITSSVAKVIQEVVSGAKDVSDLNNINIENEVAIVVLVDRPNTTEPTPEPEPTVTPNTGSGTVSPSTSSDTDSTPTSTGASN